MLSKEDLKYNRLVISFLSKVNILPVSYDAEENKIGVQTCWWRRRVSLLWQGYLLLHVCYVDWACLNYVLTNSAHHSVKSNLAHVIASILGSIILTSNAYSGLVQCRTRMFVIVKLFNEFFRPITNTNTNANANSEGTEKISNGVEVEKTSNNPPKSRSGENENLAQNRIRRLFHEIKNSSLEQLLIRFIPLLLFPVIFCFPLIYVIDPNLPITVIASVPPEQRNILVYFGCLLLELPAVFAHISVIYFGAFSILSFIETIEENTLDETRRININQKVSEVQRVLAVLKLQMSFFNLCYSEVIWVIKQCALTGGIFGGFGAIRLMYTNPPFAGIYALVFADCIILFVGMFNSAFLIGEQIQRLKRSILIPRKMRSTSQLRELRTRITSIERDFWTVEEKEEFRKFKMVVDACPLLGIKVGSFYILERESTPAFLGFVVENIVDLLLTF